MKTPNYDYVYLLGSDQKIPNYVMQVVIDLRKQFGKSDMTIQKLQHGQYVVKHELTCEKRIVYS
jgi:hypothetical protein